MSMKRFLSLFLALSIAAAAYPMTAYAAEPEASPASPAAPSAAEPDPSEKESDSTPVPTVLVSRSEVRTPIRPGRKTEVTLTFRNLSKSTLRSPVAVISPSESLMVEGGSSSFQLSDIPGESSGTVTIKLQATDSISAAVQSLGVELKFTYDGASGPLQGSASDRVTIPAAVKSNEKHPQPLVIVTRSAVEPISPDQEFPVALSLENAGNTTMESVVASVSTSDSLILQNNTSTFVIKQIAPGKTEKLPLKLKAGKELTGSTQSISVDLKYNYDAGDEMAQGSSTERVNIPVNAAEAAEDGSVPNVVVSDFQFGESTVAAGGRFPLDFTLLNTGKRPVENMIVTVDGGDSFTVDGGTNTFYYEKIPAAGKQRQSIRMQALTTAKSGAQSISVSCKYEYVDGSKRSSATSEVRLSVPVMQPDRFQVNAPVLPDMIRAGEEVTLSLPYVNKGKEEVSNVETSIEGEVDTPSASQYLGNFDSGKSGNIGFIFTPREAGRTELTLKVSYEDANQTLRTLTFPVTLEVQEAFDADLELDDLPDEEPQSGFGLWFWLAGGAAVVLIGGGVIWMRRRKNAAQTELSHASDENWDDWDDLQEPSETESGSNNPEDDAE